MATRFGLELENAILTVKGDFGWQLLKGFQLPCRPEKNWAFYTEGADLFFYYKFSPCTTVFRVDVGARTLAVLDQALCYHDAQQVRMH
jgi:hypothetical protein